MIAHPGAMISSTLVGSQAPGQRPCHRSTRLVGSYSNSSASSRKCRGKIRCLQRDPNVWCSSGHPPQPLIMVSLRPRRNDTCTDNFAGQAPVPASLAVEARSTPLRTEILRTVYRIVEFDIMSSRMYPRRARRQTGCLLPWSTIRLATH